MGVWLSLAGLIVVVVAAVALFRRPAVAWYALLCVGLALLSLGGGATPRQALSFAGVVFVGFAALDLLLVLVGRAWRVATKRRSAPE